jgi:hypothetical protein
VKAILKCVLPPLVSLLTSISCPAETPGRLFFTPEQRRLLERTGFPHPQPAPPERNGGFLQTPSGQRTQWIDGSAHSDQLLATEVGDSRETSLLPIGSVVRTKTASSP